MAMTIPAVTTIGNRASLKVTRKVWDVGKSLPFQSSYLVANSYGNKFLYPGMIVCEDPATGQYVPANESGSYGAYSYYAYASGIIYTFTDHTFEPQIIAPASRAAAIEQYCYVFGGSLGDIPNEVKDATGMKLVQWD